MPRPPVRPYKTTPLGAYNAVRTDPKTASCGVGTYPCIHKGVDIVGEPGTVVQSPADGWVIVSQKTDNPPFAGYGPAVVLIAHDDKKNADRSLLQSDPVSLRYSLLAHLDPSELRYQVPWKEAESTLLRSIETAAGKTQRGTGEAWDLLPTLPTGTVERVTKWPSWAIPIKEGEWVGKIGAARHVHWEVRSQPLGASAARLDPRAWLSDHDSSQNWEDAEPSKVVRSSGGGALLLLGAAWLILEDL
jgi:hypothetical protein